MLIGQRKQGGSIDLDAPAFWLPRGVRRRLDGGEGRDGKGRRGAGCGGPRKNGDILHDRSCLFCRTGL